MLPDQQLTLDGNDELVDVDPQRHLDVLLYWQQWKLPSPLLDDVAAAVRRAAAVHLT
jgi:LysR family transcriptional regulator (chromosome initiation inhibitor)